MPISVLNAMAARADRVLSARALVVLPATMAPHVSDEDRKRMVSDLQRRAGRKRTRRADIERTITALGFGVIRGSR